MSACSDIQTSRDFNFEFAFSLGLVKSALSMKEGGGSLLLCASVYLVNQNRGLLNHILCQLKREPSVWRKVRFRLQYDHLEPSKSKCFVWSLYSIIFNFITCLDIVTMGHFCFHWIYVYYTYIYIYIYTLVYSVIPGASQKIPDLVANSGPFPDHFWHLGHIHIFDDVLQTKAMPK